MKKILFLLSTFLSLTFISCGEKDESSSSSNSSVTTTTTTDNTTTLSAPSDLTATGAASQVTLDWTAVIGASSYTVYWDNATGVSSSSTTITSISTDNYTHSSLDNGTTYYYKVAAVDSSGMTGSLSSEVNATTALISTHNDTNSHRVGEDCISCHASGETGKGWFTASGTVFKSDKTTAYPNGTVKLYSSANQGGTLVKSIQVDGLGNFYTTESISFSSGLYPAVEYSGQTNTMQSTTTSGRCYTCHVSGGVAGNVIYGP